MIFTLLYVSLCSIFCLSKLWLVQFTFFGDLFALSPLQAQITSLQEDSRVDMEGFEI